MDVNALIGKDIVFNAGIEDQEAYPENHMRAVITDIIQSDHSDDQAEQVWKITFSYAKYDAHNTVYESSNYYDKNGSACLAAREAGYYEEVESIYFPGPKWAPKGEATMPWDHYFRVLGTETTKLVLEYKESGSTLSYMEWLEEKVLANV